MNLNLKRALALVCTLAMLLTFAPPILAVDAPAITVETAEVDVGTGTTDIDLTLTLSDNTGLAGAYMQLTYGEGLTLKSVAKGTALPGLTFTPPGDLTANPINLIFDGQDADATNGVILTLTFEVPLGEAKSFPVTLTAAPGAFYDDNIEDVDVTLVAGGIEVKAAHVHTPGKPVQENVNPASCETAGSYDEVIYCTECSEEISRTPKTIDALNHDWDDGVVTTAPTPTAEGVMTYTCKNDSSHTKTEPIPALTGTAITVSTAAETVGTGTKDVSLTLTLSGNTGLAGAYMQLTYGEGLTLKSVAKGTALPGLTFTPPGDLTANPINLIFDGQDADATNGVILTLTFEVPLSEAKSFPVTLTAASGAFYDDNIEDVDVTLVAGSIVVEEQTCDHNWVAGTPVPPTCTEAGYTPYTCSVCGKTENRDEVPALNHSFTNYVSDGNATCKDDGTKTAKCDRCDATDTITDEGSHLNVAHTLTYTADGAVITESCSVCGSHTVTATISATDATYTGEAIETASVAASEGWLGGELTITYSDNVNAGTAKASVTKDNATAEVTFTIAKATEYTITLGNLDQSVADTDHSVTATIAPADDSAEITVEYQKQGEDTWTTTAPTEIPEEGATYAVRAKLTASNNITANPANVATGTLNIVPHNWDNGTVTTPATCTEPGVMTYHCTDPGCTATKTETILPLNHSFTNYVSDNNATCKEDGTETAKCDRCDATDTRTIVDSHLAVPHTYAYTADGAVITESCSVCDNHTATATISATDATYTGEAIENAAVNYSSEWDGGDLEITYSDNVNAGTAKASITKDNAVAEVTFTIAKAPAPTVVIPDDLTQRTTSTDPVGQTTVNDTSVNDPTATWDTEYEVPLTQEEIDSGEYGTGVTTKWTANRPQTAGTYKVRTRLASSENFEVPVYTDNDPGWTEGTVKITRASSGYYNTTPTNVDHTHNLSHIPAKDATETEDGNKEHWYCPACRKYFSDAEAKNETTADAVVIPKTGTPDPDTFKFDDVKDSDWFNDPVYDVAEKGLMTGTAKNLFSPNANTTRAMLMTILARLSGVDTNGGATWYEKGLKWAMDNGISDGTNPEANITREQIVTMLYRYAKSPAADGELTFSDSDKVSAWALDAMKWATANKIMVGKSHNDLQPTSLATRAEMAAMLSRYAKLIGN